MRFQGYKSSWSTSIFLHDTWSHDWFSSISPVLAFVYSFCFLCNFGM